jgi:uncharacterized protein (DUF1501 family)
MSHTKNTRREFLRKLSYLAAGGGTAAMIPQLRMMGTALASTEFSDYRALVCIYLSGGNDAWNLLVPYDTPRFNTYATARSGVYSASGNNPNPGGLGLTLPTGNNVALQVINDGATADQYFLNPSAADTSSTKYLTTIYKNGNLAFVVNVGTLVQPIQKSDYNSTPSSRPPQLFSHSDQENLWHQANTSSTAIQGWGGRCADFLRPNNTQSTLSCVSVAGANRFEVGLNTIPYQLSSGGLTGLTGMCNPSSCTGISSTSIRNTALKGLLAETYSNDFQTEYAKVFQRGRDLYDLLGNTTTGLPAVKLNTTFPSNNGLASQLQMVAKMIKLSKASGYAQRQIYYVRTGGYDLHAGMMSGNGNHGQLLQQLAQAMTAFNTAMGPTDVNVYSNVTTFTASEFARTLQSNGSGSDHGWGSVQMVMGGAVHGGKLYSDGGGPISGFPDQTLTATNNFSRGQMIPSIGVEQYAATMASWMGVGTSDLNTIFPNLSHFSSKNLGFV